MNELSRILELYEELLTKVKLHKIEMERMREQIAALTKTTQSQAPQQEDQEVV
ncbi:hypothetical protein [uncultured Microbulbifer sp.]|uniref:hypothetical protein n=1 Tax=uncultured Microbulbifer sp. TaxID=348147 RepID=UPI0026281DEF|nr:hypothetical protein [uncultured Microbulbifer sp.]